MRDKTRIAIAAGDPAGIGPEVSLRAALDPAVRHACKAIVVGDAGVLKRHAAACRIAAELLFSSVAHGSAHDIAGKGVADAKAMIEAVLRLSKVKERLRLQPAPA